MLPPRSAPHSVGILLARARRLTCMVCGVEEGAFGQSSKPRSADRRFESREGTGFVGFSTFFGTSDSEEGGDGVEMAGGKGTGCGRKICAGGGWWTRQKEHWTGNFFCAPPAAATPWHPRKAR